MKKPDKKIILEDGQEYCGFGFGADVSRVLEIVFNTSMVGYQEILSDPSYTDQAVVMTYPLIGNYGTAADDNETETPTIGALVVREYNDEPSNFRAERTLADVMRVVIYRAGVLDCVRCGLDCGVDTGLFSSCFQFGHYGISSFCIVFIPV